MVAKQPVKAREARLPELVGDRLTVQVVHHRTAAGDRRVHVLRSEQPEKIRCSRLAHPVRGRAWHCDCRRRCRRPSPQWIAMPTKSVCASCRAAVPAGAAFEACGFEPLGRTGAKDLGHVAVWTCAGVLEDDVRERDGAEVTAGARVGHPRRGCVLGHAATGSAVTMFGSGSAGGIAGVVDEIGPVLERRRRRGRTVCLEIAVRVRDGLAVAVGVHAGEVGQDPVRGVRDEDRVVIREERAVAANEVEQVGHLLEVGRHVRVVAQEMHVVEDEVDDVTDLAFRRVESARTRVVVLVFREGRSDAEDDGRDRRENGCCDRSARGAIHG